MKIFIIFPSFCLFSSRDLSLIVLIKNLLLFISFTNISQLYLFVFQSLFMFLFYVHNNPLFLILVYFDFCSLEYLFRLRFLVLIILLLATVGLLIATFFKRFLKTSLFFLLITLLFSYSSTFDY